MLGLGVSEEYSVVQNFTCNPAERGYNITARLYTFNRGEEANTIPPDSALPKLVAYSAFTEINDETNYPMIRKAACYLAGYSFGSAAPQKKATYQAKTDWNNLINAATTGNLQVHSG